MLYGPGRRTRHISKTQGLEWKLKKNEQRLDCMGPEKYLKRLCFDIFKLVLLTRLQLLSHGWAVMLRRTFGGFDLKERETPFPFTSVSFMNFKIQWET